LGVFPKWNDFELTGVTLDDGAGYSELGGGRALHGGEKGQFGAIFFAEKVQWMEEQRRLGSGEAAHG